MGSGRDIIAPAGTLWKLITLEMSGRFGRISSSDEVSSELSEGVLSASEKLQVRSSCQQKRGDEG